MKQIIILAVLFSVPASLQAQPDTLWMKTYGGEDIDAFGYMEEIRGGGLIAGGFTKSFGAGSSDFYLIRTDSLGDTLWAKTYGGESIEISPEVHQTSDGGFIMIGRTWSFGIGIDMYAVKTDSNGNPVWSKTYGGTNEESGSSVRELPDGSFIMCGGTSSFGATGSDVWLVKTDSSGDMLWTKRYGGGDQDICISVLQTSDKGFIIAAHKNSAKSDRGDIWIIKTDSLGDSLWTRTYGGTFRDLPNDMIITSDGGLAVIGYTESFGHGMKDAWLLRLSAAGDTIWAKTYGGLKDDEGRSVIQTSDGGFLIVGWSRSFGVNIKKVWLVRTDSVGDTLWTRRFNSLPGEGNSVVQTSDGWYVVAGIMNVGKLYEDAVLMKVIIVPYALIKSDSVWLDTDADGYAEGTLDGSESYNAEGYEVISFEWSLNGEIIGTDSIMTYTLPTGTHTITLSVTDENGFSSSKDVEIDVYYNRLPLNSPASSAVTSIGDSIFFTYTDENIIYKYDSDGKILWSVAVGSSIQSALTVRRDNTIYAATQDSGLYALNIDGEVIFHTSMKRIGNVSPAIGPDGTIYIGILSRNFYAIDGSDGSVKWVIETGISAVSSPAISKSGTIYLNGGSNSLFALNPDGSVAWTFKTGGVHQYTPALDSDGNVYFSSKDGSLYAVTPSGALIWSTPLGGIVRGSPVIAADGTIYVESTDGSVYALSSSGDILWSYGTDKALSGTPVLLRGRRVCFGTPDGELFVLDPSGEVELLFKTNGAMTGPPLVTSDGIIHIGSDDGNVYMLADPYFNPDLASDPWHTFQGNNQRTGYQGTLVSVRDDKSEILPTKYSLKQNYPNPFNPVTSIEYDLPLKSHVLLTVYNLNGQEIARLTDEIKPAGRYKTGFDASGFSSGIYIYRIQTKNYSKARKMLLLK